MKREHSCLRQQKKQKKLPNMKKKKKNQTKARNVFVKVGGTVYQQLIIDS